MTDSLHEIIAAGEYKRVVYARWVKIKPENAGLTETVRCSKCGHAQAGISNYCPFCGARMDGKNDCRV